MTEESTGYKALQETQVVQDRMVCLALWETLDPRGLDMQDHLGGKVNQVYLEPKALQDPEVLRVQVFQAPRGHLDPKEIRDSPV